MRILVVSPHPDDETLGAGGTISRLKKEGHSVYWLIMTTIKGHSKYETERIDEREREIEIISELYHFDGVKRLEFPTATLDQVSDDVAVGKVSDYFKEIEPQILILPDYNDIHSDHKKTFSWCMACSKWFRFPFIKTVMTMEILSETDFGTPKESFVPDVFVDISDCMDEKINALQIYASELGQPPFPRSVENIKALAAYRGAMCGAIYAEGFKLIKHIM